MVDIFSSKFVVRDKIGMNLSQMKQDAPGKSGDKTFKLLIKSSLIDVTNQQILVICHLSSFFFLRFKYSRIQSSQLFKLREY